MSKFILTDWEINGYDDSDFMCSYYDDKANKVLTFCYGTTRAAAATNIGIGPDGKTSVVVDGEHLMLPTAEVVEKARLVLAEYIYQTIKEADKRTVDEPGMTQLRAGLRVKLISDVRMQVKKTEPCQKCGGSGNWTNPRNPADKRPCFNCKGTGQWTGGKATGEDGKTIWEKLPAGLSGEVVDWKSFGTFYRSGYNTPGRDNTTVQFKTDSGRIVRASLSKLRLDRDYQDDQALRQKAESLSLNLQFSKFYPRHAWDTRNYAAEVFKPLSK